MRHKVGGFLGRKDEGGTSPGYTSRILACSRVHLAAGVFPLPGVEVGPPRPPGGPLRDLQTLGPMAAALGQAVGRFQFSKEKP
jgi:hypothetical protein